MTTRVKVYSTGVCPICDKTKTLLSKWKIPFQEIRIDLDQNAMREFSVVTNGARTVLYTFTLVVILESGLFYELE